MPARKLQENPIRVPSFSAVGTQAAASASILHCAICISDQDLKIESHAEAIGVSLLSLDKTCTAHAAGWIELTPDERQGIEAWLHRFKTQVTIPYRAHIFHPAFERTKDETTGRQIGLRCSCSGFVFLAYKEGASISLVRIEALPPTSRMQLESIWGYPAVDRAFRRQESSTSGLCVLLPGHILNAMRMDRINLPYTPSAGDHALSEDCAIQTEEAP